MIKLSDLLLEISINRLKIELVNSNKMSASDFKKIEDFHAEISTTLKSSTANTYAEWLARRVVKNIIPPSEIDSYVDFILAFDADKDKFPIQNILSIKTKNDVAKFKEIATKLASGSGSGGVNKAGIKRLKEVGIDIIGEVDGYQIFHIPVSVKNNEDAYITYKNVLGKCANRTETNIVSICTLTSHKMFKDYLGKNPDGLFVIYNISDPLSPYQLNFGDEPEFKDKNDDTLI